MQNWIELAALMVTILGGGGVGVSKLTRVAVAVENAVEAIKTVVEDVKAIEGTVNAHGVTLAEHGQQLQALRGAAGK